MKFIPKYRFLKVGEKIRATDRFYVGIQGHSYSDWKFCISFIGNKVTKKEKGTIRRKVGCEIFHDARYELITTFYDPKTGTWTTKSESFPNGLSSQNFIQYYGT